MSDIQSLPITSGRNRHTAYIAVGNAMNRFSHLSLGFKIHSSMKVVRTQFTEITAQNKRKIKRRTEYRSSRFFLCPYSKNTAQSCYDYIIS